jgi:hypothetical protein
VGTLHYQLVIRNADDTGDLLSVSSLRDGVNPYIASPPSGDGEEVEPLSGKVTVGAYTVEVIDAETQVPVVETAFADDFEGYADTAALLAAWTETDPTGNATWTLDADNPETGAKAVRMAVTGTLTVGEVYSLSRTITGLAPGATCEG